jgi:hypothetical protein
MSRSYDVWIGRGAQAISQERNISELAATHGQDIHILDDTIEVESKITAMNALETNGDAVTPENDNIIDTYAHSDVITGGTSVAEITVFLPHKDSANTKYIMKQNTITAQLATDVTGVFPNGLSPRLYIDSNTGVNKLTLEFHVIFTVSSSDPNINQWNIALATKIHRVPGGSLYTEYHHSGLMKFVEPGEVEDLTGTPNFSIGNTIISNATKTNDGSSHLYSVSKIETSEKFAMNIYKIKIDKFDSSTVVEPDGTISSYTPGEHVELTDVDDLTAHTIEFIRIDLVPGDAITSSYPPSTYLST